MNFFSQFNKDKLIAAHRGFRALYPENTLLAFTKAMKKSDFIEFDVQFTKDNIPIVFHDNKLLRTTNAKTLKGFKKPYYIWDYTYQELQQLDISTWFYNLDPFFQQERLKKPKKIERIPTLSQTINLAKKHNMPINIEIKYKDTHKLNPTQIQIIIDTIQYHGYVDKTIVSSFSHEYIKVLKQLAPDISTAALAHEKYPHDLVSYLKDLQVDAYHINKRLATKKLIQQLSQNGIVVNVYTINNKLTQEKLYRYGVKGIFTDFL